jgi:hypothetical protein
VKAPEEFPDFGKEFSECALTSALTSAKSLNHLNDMDVIIARTKIIRETLTERRMLIAVKITPAGGYTYKINIRALVMAYCHELTIPTPAPTNRKT